jgi:mitosis inhibitor protein kinase SWE1
MSLPAFANPKVHRTLHHRQSHPATRPQEGDDIFESRFITLETLGKGAFSTVIKVQDRDGEGLWAVKKARGVFDGVRDRYVFQGKELG